MTTASADNSVTTQALPAAYAYAALLDEEGNELPITETMIRSAFEDAWDRLYAFLPQRCQNAGQTSLCK